MKALGAPLAILQASLRRELRTGEALLPMLLFSLVVVLVSGFAFDLPELEVSLRGRLITGILWISIAFAMIVGQARHLLADRQDERLSGLMLAPLDRTALFAVKWLEGFMLGVALEIVLVPLCVVLFDLDLAGRLLPLAAVLAVCTAGLAALGTILGTVVARIGRGEALLAILVLPAAAPVLIAGVRSTEAVFEGGTLAAAAPWPTVALTTLVIYAAVGAMLYESVLVE